ncbi:hypothetical protein D910_03396 [Dendroctonus ponderosae]|uniref:Uncharacterized protein n=1 Tax=Dendroctonus ponderosae TaxID=77166 RepID=U4TYS8_DENPD|nr:hypothetical protein D910_03396 [Dendroctonus ponderosae]
MGVPENKPSGFIYFAVLASLCLLEKLEFG